MAVDHSWQTALHPGEADDFFAVDQPAPFVPDTDEFNLINAWWLSELSRLIYKRDQTEGVFSVSSRADYLAGVGLVERHFFSHPNVQAALVETIDSAPAAFATLVFRGTAGRLSNWLFNLDIAPLAWPAGGRVHRGFGHLLMVLWEEIATTVNTIERPVFFTGHSLGGALATLAASLFPPQAVYTFGSPRIGDAAFAQTLSKVQVFNVSNPHDIVTQLPPDGRRIRFAHAGTVIKNIDPQPARRPFSRTPAFLAGHAPRNYTLQLPVAFAN